MNFISSFLHNLSLFHSYNYFWKSFFKLFSEHFIASFYCILLKCLLTHEIKIRQSSNRFWLTTVLFIVNQMVQKKMMWISSMHFCWRVIKHLSYANWRNTKTVYSIWMRKHSERGKTTQNDCVIYLSMKELLHEVVILFHTRQISSCENEWARVNPVCRVSFMSFPHLNARRRYSKDDQSYRVTL